MSSIEANGVETYYEEYGDGDPIVVLHGGGADHQAWAEQLQPLADEYRILLYDLRGHGKTGGSDRDTYSVDLYVDDLAAFIDALDLTRPTILGHSWGGMIGYRFAATHPDSLSGLITVGSMTSHTFSKGEWLYSSVVMNAVAPFMSNERFMNALNWVQERIFGEDSSGDLDELERLREEHGCDVPDMEPKERGKVPYAFADYFGSSRPIQGITVPVLMLYGEDEPHWLEAHAEYLQTELAECRTAEIPDAGHNSQADNPDFILSRVQNFITNEVNAPESRENT